MELIGLAAGAEQVARKPEDTLREGYLLKSMSYSMTGVARRLDSGQILLRAIRQLALS